MLNNIKSKKNSKKDEKTKLARSQEDAQKNFEGWKRALADYANLKREFEENQKKLIVMAEEKVLSEILPALEMFNRAISTTPDDIKENSWVQGMGHIKAQFDEILSHFGVETIKTVGEQFDPLSHDAIAEEEIEGFSTGMVIKEATSGYKMNGKVIIPAKVIVAK